MFHLLSKQMNKMSALASTKVIANITAFFPKRIFGFHSYCFRRWVPIRLGGTNHYSDCGIAKSHVPVSFGLHESKSPMMVLFFLFWALFSCSQKYLAKTPSEFTPVYTATSFFTWNAHFDSLFMKRCCSTSFSFSK